MKKRLYFIAVLHQHTVHRDTGKAVGAPNEAECASNDAREAPNDAEDAVEAKMTLDVQ